MPNSYFQFKQFTVHQERSAMKVCTDACILGAWVSKKVYDGKHLVANCLDIGTGTGLLSLMLAQKNPDIEIDAVEIEENAFEQAKENFMNSPWAQRINAIHADVENIASSIKYDLIITNPPFLKEDLLPSSVNKRLAMHEEGLSAEVLMNTITNHLADNGHFAILLPYHRVAFFEKLIQQNKFFVHDKLSIRQTPLHNFFRAILFCGTQPKESIQNELIIKNAVGEYTSEFRELLKDYYLKL